jgi:amino acid transporter
MNTLVTNQVAAFIAVIEQQAVPALRVGFTLAVIIFLLAGVFIWRRRHQFFDRDPNVENDVPAVRHNRVEEVVFVWSGLMLVLLSILFQVWSA